MSFLVGKTEQTPNVNDTTSSIQQMLVELLSGGGDFSKLFPGTTVDDASIEPYRKMFAQNNERNLAQAKESAGNLTGSGLATAIGGEAGRANTEQGAFLAQLFERRRQEDANRAAGLLLGGINGPAAGVTTTYQPGILDYAAQGVTGLASGGAFNNLFNRNKPTG